MTFALENRGRRGSGALFTYHHAFRNAKSWQLSRPPRISMHTPEGFTPSHTLPASLPDGTLAFAFRDTKLVVGGSEEAPSVPPLSMLLPLISGVPIHYLGDLAGTSCVAVGLAEDVPVPEAWRLAGLRSLFFRLPEALLAL